MTVVDFNSMITYEAVDAGDYLATLTKKEYIPQSKNSGNPMERLTFTLSDVGQNMFRNCSLLPTGLLQTKEFLASLGVDPEDMVGSVDIDELITPFVGSTYMLSLSKVPHWNKEEAAKGKFQNNIIKARAV